MNCRGLSKEVSEEKSFSMWPRDHSYDALVKKVAAFVLVQGVCLRLQRRVLINSVGRSKDYVMWFLG